MPGNPLDRGAWLATVRKVAKSWAQLKWLSTHASIVLLITNCFNFSFLRIYLCPLYSWMTYLQDLKLEVSSLLLSVFEKYCVTSFLPLWFHMRKHCNLNWLSSWSNVSVCYGCFIWGCVCVCVCVLLLLFFICITWIKFPGMDLFEFVHLGLYSIFWNCSFMSFIKFGKFLAIISSKDFCKYFKYSPHLQDFIDMDISSFNFSTCHFFSLLSFCCWTWVNSIDLSSSSLILYPVIFILVLKLCSDIF